MRHDRQLDRYKDLAAAGKRYFHKVRGRAEFALDGSDDCHVFQLVLVVSRNFFEELFRPTPRAGCKLQEANDELKSIDARRASRTPGIRKRFLTSASIIYYNDFPLRCDSVR